MGLETMGGIGSMTQKRTAAQINIGIQQRKVDLAKSAHEKELAKVRAARLEAGRLYETVLIEQFELWKMIDAEKKKKK